MTTQTFAATEDELELATRILITRGCNGTSTSSPSASSSSDVNNGNDDGEGEGTLQGDQAKEVFNRSALPFATLRVIWNMSSEKGNGSLEKHEIAKALRLIGWVQAGEMLSERLLAVGVYVSFFFVLCVCGLMICFFGFFLLSGAASDVGWDNE